jgi:hypothetical protein
MCPRPRVRRVRAAGPAPGRRFRRGTCVLGRAELPRTTCRPRTLADPPATPCALDDCWARERPPKKPARCLRPRALHAEPAPPSSGRRRCRQTTSLPQRTLTHPPREGCRCSPGRASDLHALAHRLTARQLPLRIVRNRSATHPPAGFPHRAGRRLAPNRSLLPRQLRWRAHAAGRSTSMTRAPVRPRRSRWCPDADNFARWQRARETARGRWSTRARSPASRSARPSSGERGAARARRGSAGEACAPAQVAAAAARGRAARRASACCVRMAPARARCRLSPSLATAPRAARERASDRDAAKMASRGSPSAPSRHRADAATQTARHPGGDHPATRRDWAERRTRDPSEAHRQRRARRPHRRGRQQSGRPSRLCFWRRRDPARRAWAQRGGTRAPPLTVPLTSWPPTSSLLTRSLPMHPAAVRSPPLDLPPCVLALEAAPGIEQLRPGSQSWPCAHVF